MIEITEDSLDLSRLIRAGDTVFWSHGTNEPLVLTSTLMEQRAAIGRFRAFLGPTFSRTFHPEHADHVDFLSYCGIGANQALHAVGALDIVPCHLSALPGLIETGQIPCDVALLHLSAENDTGAFGLGVSNDIMLDAAVRARVVIAEVNAAAPWTIGPEELSGLKIDYVVRTSRPVPELSRKAPGDAERRMAGLVAELIPDGATVQVGIGAIPQAVLAALRDHRDLGLHAGIIPDETVDLIESGAITNAFKPIDRGISVTGMLAGTQRLYDFAHERSDIRLRPVRYTHAQEVLARLPRLHAVNSAIEVDLTGQVNAEMVGESYVGAVGGQLDFIRGSQRSTGGRSIIALPSTAASGTRSRIVARLPEGVVTTPRSDADIFVTEWGVAELRGRPLAERATRLARIAHPDFREELERAAYALRSGA